MRVVNKTGFPVSIIENGKKRTIPYDRAVYIVDDSCYDDYKELFHIVEPPKPVQEVEKKFTEDEFEKYIKDREKNKRPLDGHKIKVEKYLNEKTGVKNTVVWMKKRKSTPKNKIVWNVINEQGERFENVDIKSWCKEHGIAVNNAYRYADMEKPLNGWKFEKIVTDKKQNKPTFKCMCKRCLKGFEGRGPRSNMCDVCKEEIKQEKEARKRNK